jgi:adenosylhomocysteine nucleosidase
MADEVVDSHGHHIPVDLHVKRESLEHNPGLRVGRLLTLDLPLHSAEEKHRLGQNHDVLACDMETLGVARACQSRQVPFLSVRIISESVHDELPKGLERMREQKSLAGKLGAAAGALWNRPGTIKEMWQLKEDAFRASDRLAKFLAGVVANLPK